MVLLSGGVDGGTKSHVVELAEILSAANPKPRLGNNYKLPIIYAGNKEARKEVNVNNLNKEFEKFNLNANQWWVKNGNYSILHKINNIRIKSSMVFFRYIFSIICFDTFFYNVFRKFVSTKNNFRHKNFSSQKIEIFGNLRIP